MAARGIPMTCAGCGKRWTVEPKPDGSYPQISRCPRYRGGCGKQHAVRARRPAAAKGSPSRPAPSALTVPAWDPPSPPRLPQRLAEPCPRCGAAEVRASERGTVRGCYACKRRVTPPGVLAPYEHGTEVTRHAKSRQERDDDAKAAVVAAGEFLRVVRAMGADPRIHPASADLLGWYEEELTEARKNRDAARLAELRDEFAAGREAGEFRRRHWWQGEVRAADDEEDDEDQDDEPADLPRPVVRGEIMPAPAEAPVTLATPDSIAEQQHRAQRTA